MRILTTILMAILATGVLAAESYKNDEALEQVRQTIEKQLQSAKPSLQVTKVIPSGIGNLYEVYLSGGMMLYGTEDGSHIIEGRVYRVGENQFVDVREEKLKPLRAEVLGNVPVSEMIVYSPKGETKAVVNVFTDVDCGYCQKFHNNMTAYNELGIEVRYLGFPRAGHGSSSEKKLVSAWCSDNPEDAMTKLKRRQRIPEKLCDSPVPTHYELGQRLGVNGTPSLFTSDGTMIPGYREPDQLARDLGLL